MSILINFQVLTNKTININIDNINHILLIIYILVASMTKNKINFIGQKNEIIDDIINIVKKQTLNQIHDNILEYLL